jgi:hypothetical protein
MKETVDGVGEDMPTYEGNSRIPINGCPLSKNPKKRRSL